MKRKQMFKGLVQGAVATALTVSMAASSMAVNFVDTWGHWAESEIDRWNEEGVVMGYDGYYRPDNYIKRGDMAIMLNQVMEYHVDYISGTHPNWFPDVTVHDLIGNYYDSSINRLHTAWLMIGSDSYVRPEEFITRQEAAVMLAKAFHLDTSYGPSSSFYSRFGDSNEVSSWALNGVYAMTTSNDYMLGREGNLFAPQEPITRAEVAQILDKMIISFVQQPVNMTGGTYDGNMVINTASVNLSGDMRIKGDLIIAEGVADGDIHLTDVQVDGNIIIKGGSTNTIYLCGVTASSLEVSRMDAPTLVVLCCATDIPEITVEHDCIIDATDLDDGYEVGKVELNGDNDFGDKPLDVTVWGKVDDIINNYEPTNLTVSGPIGDITLNEDCTVNGTDYDRNDKVDMSTIPGTSATKAPNIILNSVFPNATGSAMVTHTEPRLDLETGDVTFYVYVSSEKNCAIMSDPENAITVPDGVNLSIDVELIDNDDDDTFGTTVFKVTFNVPNDIEEVELDVNFKFSSDLPDITVEKNFDAVDNKNNDKFADVKLTDVELVMDPDDGSEYIDVTIIVSGMDGVRLPTDNLNAVTIDFGSKEDEDDYPELLSVTKGASSNDMTAYSVKFLWDSEEYPELFETLPLLVNFLDGSNDNEFATGLVTINEVYPDSSSSATVTMTDPQLDDEGDVWFFTLKVRNIKNCKLADNAMDLMLTLNEDSDTVTYDVTFISETTTTITYYVEIDYKSSVDEIIFDLNFVDEKELIVPEEITVAVNPALDNNEGSVLTYWEEGYNADAAYNPAIVGDEVVIYVEKKADRNNYDLNATTPFALVDQDGDKITFDWELVDGIPVYKITFDGDVSITGVVITAQYEKEADPVGFVYDTTIGVYNAKTGEFIGDIVNGAVHNAYSGGGNTGKQVDIYQDSVTAFLEEEGYGSSEYQLLERMGSYVLSWEADPEVSAAALVSGINGMGDYFFKADTNNYNGISTYRTNYTEVASEIGTGTKVKFNLYVIPVADVDNKATVIFKYGDHATVVTRYGSFDGMVAYANSGDVIEVHTSFAETTVTAEVIGQSTTPLVEKASNFVYNVTMSTDSRYGVGLTITDPESGGTTPPDVDEDTHFTLTVPEDGSTTVKPDTSGVDADGKVETGTLVTVTPDPDKTVESVTVVDPVTGNALSPAVKVDGPSNGDYTFMMPDEDCKVEVLYSYKVTVEDVTNGSASAPETAVEGTDVTVTVTPATGYKVGSVVYTVGTTNTVVSLNSDGKYVFTMPSSDITVKVTFIDETTKTNKLTFETGATVTVDGDNVESPADVEVGKEVVVKVPEGKEASFTGLTTQPTPVVDAEGNKTYTFVMPDVPVDVKVEDVAPEVNNIVVPNVGATVTYVPAGGGSTVTVTSPGGVVPAGATVTVKPDDGYTPGVSGATATPDGSNLVFTMPGTGTVTVTADKDDFTVTATAVMGTNSSPAISVESAVTLVGAQGYITLNGEIPTGYELKDVTVSGYSGVTVTKATAAAETVIVTLSGVPTELTQNVALVLTVNLQAETVAPDTSLNIDFVVNTGLSGTTAKGTYVADDGTVLIQLSSDVSSLYKLTGITASGASGIGISSLPALNGQFIVAPLDITAGLTGTYTVTIDLTFELLSASVGTYDLLIKVTAEAGMPADQIAELVTKVIVKSSSGDKDFTINNTNTTGANQVGALTDGDTIGFETATGFVRDTDIDGMVTGFVSGGNVTVTVHYYTKNVTSYDITATADSQTFQIGSTDVTTTVPYVGTVGSRYTVVPTQTLTSAGYVHYVEVFDASGAVIHASDSNYTFTMIGEDVTVKVSEIEKDTPKYSITYFKAAGENVPSNADFNVTFNGESSGNEAIEGATVTVTTHNVPNGYTVRAVMVSKTTGGTVLATTDSATGTGSFTMPDSDVIVYIHFDKTTPKYTVEMGVGTTEDGYAEDFALNGEDDVTKWIYDENTFVTITPAPSSVIAKVEVDYNDGNGKQLLSTTGFTVTSDCTVYVTYQEAVAGEYILSKNTVNGDFDLTVDGESDPMTGISTSVAGTTPIKISLPSGKVAADVKEVVFTTAGTTPTITSFNTDGEATFAMPEANCEVKVVYHNLVTFAKDPVGSSSNVTVSASTTGTVSASTGTKVTVGETVTVSVSEIGTETLASDGIVVTATGANGSYNVAVNDKTFVMPNDPVTIVVKFTASYRISVPVTSEATPVFTRPNGSTVALNGTYIPEGEEITVSVTDKPEHTTEVTYTYANDPTNGTYQVVGGKFTMPSGDVTVTVKYIANKYNVAVKETSRGEVSVTTPFMIVENGDSYVDGGVTVTISAVPERGYILNLSDSNTKLIETTVKSNNEYTLKIENTIADADGKIVIDLQFDPVVLSGSVFYDYTDVSNDQTVGSTTFVYDDVHNAYKVTTPLPSVWVDNDLVTSVTISGQTYGFTNVTNFSEDGNNLEIYLDGDPTSTDVTISFTAVIERATAQPPLVVIEGLDSAHWNYVSYVITETATSGKFKIEITDYNATNNGYEVESITLSNGTSPSTEVSTTHGWYIEVTPDAIVGADQLTVTIKYAMADFNLTSGDVTAGSAGETAEYYYRVGINEQTVDGGLATNAKAGDTITVTVKDVTADYEPVVKYSYGSSEGEVTTYTTNTSEHLVFTFQMPADDTRIEVYLKPIEYNPITKYQPSVIVTDADTGDISPEQISNLEYGVTSSVYNKVEDVLVITVTPSSALVGYTLDTTTDTVDGLITSLVMTIYGQVITLSDIDIGETTAGSGTYTITVSDVETYGITMDDSIEVDFDVIYTKNVVYYSFSVTVDAFTHEFKVDGKQSTGRAEEGQSVVIELKPQTGVSILDYSPATSATKIRETAGYADVTTSYDDLLVDDILDSSVIVGYSISFTMGDENITIIPDITALT